MSSQHNNFYVVVVSWEPEWQTSLHQTLGSNALLLLPRLAASENTGLWEKSKKHERDVIFDLAALTTSTVVSGEKFDIMQLFYKTN